MNTCGSSYKKSSVACSIRNKTSGDPCTEVTAAMPKVFALWEWELESDPNYTPITQSQNRDGGQQALQQKAQHLETLPEQITII